jgi:hypothetical protein
VGGSDTICFVDYRGGGAAATQYVLWVTGGGGDTICFVGYQGGGDTIRKTIDTAAQLEHLTYAASWECGRGFSSPTALLAG